MDEISAVVHGECQRFGDLRTNLIIGRLGAEALDMLAGEVKMIVGDGDVISAIVEADPADLVVYVDSSGQTDLGARASGRALAGVVERGLILIFATGQDVPVPLIELKRGLSYGKPGLSYRTFGRQ